MTKKNSQSVDPVSDAANRARELSEMRVKKSAEIYRNVSHKIDFIVAQRSFAPHPSYGVDDYVIKPLLKEISVSFSDAAEGSRGAKIDKQSHVITISGKEAVIVTNTNGTEARQTISLETLDAQDATTRILQSIPQVKHP